MGEIIGIVGPSGVGKGYAKQQIKSGINNGFVEPIVVTTRPLRPYPEPDRMAGAPIVPEINSERCTVCYICIPICLQEAIVTTPAENTRGHIVDINAESCVGCGHCVTVCPTKAIEL